MQYTFKRLLIGLAVLFGAFSLLRLLHHDLQDGLWGFGVALALVLGLLPSWLTEPRPRKPEPEKYKLN